MRQIEMYEQVDETFMKEKGLKATGMRWVIVHVNLLIRARPIAQETKRTTTLELDNSSVTPFAATPLLEASHLVMSQVMSGPKGATEETVLAFLTFVKRTFQPRGCWSSERQMGTGLVTS